MSGIGGRCKDEMQRLCGSQVFSQIIRIDLNIKEVSSLSWVKYHRIKPHLKFWISSFHWQIMYH